MMLLLAIWLLAGAAMPPMPAVRPATINDLKAGGPLALVPPPRPVVREYWWGPVPSCFATTAESSLDLTNWSYWPSVVSNGIHSLRFTNNWGTNEQRYFRHREVYVCHWGPTK